MSREMWARDQKSSKRTKLLPRMGSQEWGQVYFVGIVASYMKIIDNSFYHIC